MKIIYICTGNTCRSPMAEGYAKAVLSNIHTVESRGLFTDGSIANPNSVSVMKEIGIDISNHISATLSKKDLDADLLICLENSHADKLIGAGIKKEKTAVLGEGVSDPYGQDIDKYRECRDKIICEINKRLFDGVNYCVSVTEATPDDINDIALIEKECFSEPWSENAIRESMAAGTLFYIAKKKDAALGYIGISAIAGEGYITNIGTHKNVRNHGIGSILISKILSEAILKKLEFVSLEVRESNEAAQRLYSRFGFVTEGKRKGFYQSPKEDALIMTRRF